MTEAAVEYLLCDVGDIRRFCDDHGGSGSVLSWNSVLSADEIAQSDRLRHASDRVAYRCAHLIFRLMAARRLGLEPSEAGDLRFTRRCHSCGGAHGKPQIVGAGAGAELSLSRSGDTMLVASAPASSPIGADVERVPEVVFTGFDDYVLAPTEPVPHGRDADRRRLELWVAKEAAVKATGQGLAVAPGEMAVARSAEESLPAASAHWSGTITAPEHPGLNRLHVAPVPCKEGCVGALSSAETLPIAALELSDLLAD